MENPWQFMRAITPGAPGGKDGFKTDGPDIPNHTGCLEASIIIVNHSPLNNQSQNTMKTYYKNRSIKRHRNTPQGDRIGLVGFHSQSFVITPPLDAYSPVLQQRTQQLYRRLGGYGTNITAGLKLAITSLISQPRNRLRRIWLLTDGHPTSHLEGIMPAVRKAHANHININTVGIGDQYDERLLRLISGSTHNGKFIHVSSLNTLAQALQRNNHKSHGRKTRHPRPETTILTVDCSPSMAGTMYGMPKIQIVSSAILDLLLYKQRLYS